MEFMISLFLNKKYSIIFLSKKDIEIAVIHGYIQKKIYYT